MKKLIYKVPFFVFCVTTFFNTVANGQNSIVKSGPMLGYSEMREVLLWVQLNDIAWVHFEYKEMSSMGKTYSTDKKRAEKVNAYVVKCIADELEPGKRYEYTLFVNGEKIDFSYPLTFNTPKQYQYRENAPDFSFSFGSCTYINDSIYDRPGKAYGGNYEIFESIYNKRPDFMIWGGDNIYLREPDWGSLTGILYRYTHTRSLPQLQPLLAIINHYAIWDDHDYGPNDSDKSFNNKEISAEAFKLFWGNKSYGVDKRGGIYSTFIYNDVQFFLMDNRSFRSPNGRITGNKDYFGQEQLNWLIDGLVSSKATFKVIVSGGQILNPAKVYENYANYIEERDLLLDYIKKENIKNILFLTGDRHHTELSTFLNGELMLYDLTVSPLTSGYYIPKTDEGNLNRVEGTLVNQRNFSIIEVSKEKENRKMSISIFDSQGKLLWEKSVFAQ
jgi:alkaline phosphatase D